MQLGPVYIHIQHWEQSIKRIFTNQRLTDILSSTVSELSQLIVQILDSLRFRATLWGLGRTYDVYLGLIGKRVVDFLLVLIKPFSLGVIRLSRYERIWTENRRFRSNESGWYKISGRRGRPPPHLLLLRLFQLRQNAQPSQSVTQDSDYLHS